MAETLEEEEETEVRFSKRFLGEEKVESLKSLERWRGVRKAVEIVEDGGGVEDVDLILEKYKHLKETNDCEMVMLKEQKEGKSIFPNETEKEEDSVGDNGFELDEREAELLMTITENNNKEVDSKQKEVNEELFNAENCRKDDEGDNDCVEDTSDYLTEPEEEESDTIFTNKEGVNTVIKNPGTQKVVLGLDLENPVKKRKVKCNQCDWTGGQTGLNYHKKSKHLGVRFKCPHCEFRSPRTEYLSSHITSKHIKVVEKMIRDAATVPIEDGEIFEKQVAAEIELEVNKAKFQKEEIGQDYPHSSSEKLEKEETEKKEGAKENLQLSEKETGFKCSQCEWVVGTGNGLRYHQRTVHEGLKNGKYKCNCCEFKSTSKSYMTNHMIVEHKGQKGNEESEAGGSMGSSGLRLSLHDPVSLLSKIKTEQEDNDGVGKDSNIDWDEEEDQLLPPFWQPADGSGLVFNPPASEGKARRFESYQLAVKWLIETGDPINAAVHAGFRASALGNHTDGHANSDTRNQMGQTLTMSTACGWASRKRAGCLNPSCLQDGDEGQPYQGSI